MVWHGAADNKREPSGAQPKCKKNIRTWRYHIKGDGLSQSCRPSWDGTHASLNLLRNLQQWHQPPWTNEEPQRKLRIPQLRTCGWCKTLFGNSGQLIVPMPTAPRTRPQALKRPMQANQGHDSIIVNYYDSSLTKKKLKPSSHGLQE